MRRALGYLAIFVIGIAAGWMLLRSVSIWPAARTPDAIARQRALSLLERPPQGVPVPDTILVKAAERIEPAVVNIEVVSAQREFPGTPFEQLYMAQGRGSGVVISPDGYIATNNHVIENAEMIRVTLTDGRKLEGRVVGADPEADLAVVKVDASKLPTAELGDSDKLKVGQYVLAIGYPLGLGTTVTHGIISATDRENLPVEQGRFLRRALQTDAPINPGNSGGALANENGQLVGINTAIASRNNGGSIGIGFAIPVNAARGVLESIIRQGGGAAARTGGRAFLGVTFLANDADLQQYGMAAGEGAVVANVVPLSPADTAGLARGNVIVSVDGRPIRGSEDLRGRLAAHRPGDRVTLGLVRGNGSVDQVQVTLAHWPAGTGR